MSLPSTGEVLTVWDAGAGQDHAGRALLLASLARNPGAAGELAALPIGARDGLLLDLRERLFGARVEAVDCCPACATTVEIAFDVADIRVAGSAPPLDQVLVRAGGVDIEARPPTTADLLALRTCRDVGEARQVLLHRCVVAVDGQEPAGADALQEEAQAEIARALSEADPQADIELALTCAACGHDWRTHFDIVRFLWAEIEHYGTRVLRDVHLLARAYGWSERETLALSPRRRRRYLEMVDDG
jgi:hypothetical protein